MFEGLLEVIEVGMMEALITPSAPWLFIPSWLFVIFGLFVQLRCLKKGIAKWFLISLAAALVASEILCQVITGWDVLLFLILYGFLIDILIGVVVATAVHCLKRQ